MILCCGEALIDMLPAETLDGDKAFVPHAGGAVFNTSIALGRQSVSVGLMTGLSTDMFGQQLQNALEASHVDNSLAIRTDRPTTLAFVKLDNGHASYSFVDENSAGRMLAPSDMPAISGNISTLYFGGISLACEPCADAYAALLEREAEDHLVMLDPNIRPSFIADEARFRARLDRMLIKTDILKVSDEDLDWIIPGSATHESKARQILAKGASLVILTRGRDGASGFLSDGSTVDVPATLADVVDTVGAGDTFNAGVLAKLSDLGLLSKQSIEAISQSEIASALEHGARTAAVTVSRAGANPPWDWELTAPA